jgi:hypothetical protein
VTPRDRIVVLVLAAAAAVAGFWFGVLGPQRKEISKLDQQVAAEQQRMQQAQSASAQGRAAKARYVADYASVAVLGKAVPVDDDVPSLVYQLEKAADGAHIDFRSIKLSAGGGSSAATSPAPPAAATAAVGAAEKGGGGKSSATPAPATQAAAATLPPGAKVGSAGFPTMPFAFTFDGSFFAMERFLRNVQEFIRVNGSRVDVHGRLLAIDGISLSAGGDGFPKVKASIGATAYLLPAEQGVLAGATPQGPSGAPPASASPSGGTAPPTTTATATGVTR